MRTTPDIPSWIGKDKFQPHYTNIHALLDRSSLTPDQKAENRRRLYGTETMSGFNDWDVPTLLLAKDAGPVQTFTCLIAKGDPQPWRHARREKRDCGGVATNERLRGCGHMIPGSKLYGSVMAGLLRNDGKLRGTLPNFNNATLRAYVRRVLEEFVLPNMPKLCVVLCLGDEACKVMGAVIGSNDLNQGYDALRRVGSSVDFNGIKVFPAWHPVASELGENVARVWTAAAHIVRGG